MELYCSLSLGFGIFCTEYAGDFDGRMQMLSESPLGYRTEGIGILTPAVIRPRDRARRAV